MPLPVAALVSTNGASPPMLSGSTFEAVELLPGLVEVGVGQVDLVDGDDERHAGGLGVVDGFLGLRHDAVVGGDDDDGDVGDLGAAGPHLGERLVAGRVEEGDRPAAVLDAPGADDLRDAAGFGGGDVALANLVQQRRLAVIDVAHDGDDRGARHQVFRLVGLLEAGQQLLPRRRPAVLISSSQPCSRANSSARSGSSVELMLVVRMSRPWV